jgi:hypothetical protein
VRRVGPSSEEEAAATFTRAELASARFRGLPDDFDWHRLALAPDEVLSIRYIHWHWWLKISGATRSPREAARRIRAGLVPGAEVEGDRRIAERLRSDDPPPELIAVAAPDGPLVLLEGHVRLTAYAVWPEYLPDELEILLGVSESAWRWGCY